MSKTEILSKLQQDADANGVVQFDFSSDLSVKKVDLYILKELVYDVYITKLTNSLGYAIYSVH